jgi:hypothetical protein
MLKLRNDETIKNTGVRELEALQMQSDTSNLNYIVFQFIVLLLDKGIESVELPDIQDSPKLGRIIVSQTQNLACLRSTYF